MVSTAAVIPKRSARFILRVFRCQNDRSQVAPEYNKKRPWRKTGPAAKPQHTPYLGDIQEKSKITQIAQIVQTGFFAPVRLCVNFLVGKPVFFAIMSSN
jgi:hypothetical protein